MLKSDIGVSTQTNYPDECAVRDEDEMRATQMGDKAYWVRSFIKPRLQMGLLDHHIKERSHHVRAERKAWVLKSSS